MSRLISTLFALLLIATSCNKSSNQETAQLYHESAKPLVAIVPMIDRTSNPDISWSLSEELTSSLSRQLQQHGKVGLVNEQKVRALTKNLKNSHDPFGIDISWAKQAFPQQQFVVFLELMEHEEVAAVSKKEEATTFAAADLNMSMRLRIIDLRRDRAQIVLQEIVHDSHHLPKQFTKANFEQIPWGKENYHVTPLGMAHAVFTKEIASRLEDYILLASTR